MDPIEEPTYGAGKIERHIPHAHAVFEKGPSPGRSGRRKGGHHQREMGIVLAQRGHEWGGGLHLSHGHRVDPDTVRIEPRAEAVALAEIAPVAAILQTADQQQ